MVTLKISDETYALVCQQVASILESQIFDGRVSEWDELNEKALRALLELNSQHIRYVGVG